MRANIRVRKFRMHTRYLHQRSEGTRGSRFFLDSRQAEPLRITCAHQACEDEATATVLAGATRVPYCFTHEREYADRYGPTDIYALA